MSLSVLRRYMALVADGRIEADLAQAELAARLDSARRSGLPAIGPDGAPAPSAA